MYHLPSLHSVVYSKFLEEGVECFQILDIYDTRMQYEYRIYDKVNIYIYIYIYYIEMKN